MMLQSPMLSVRSALSVLRSMRVARANGQLQLIGNRNDVVREQGPVVRRLIIEVVEAGIGERKAGCPRNVATFVKPLFPNGGAPKFTRPTPDDDRNAGECGERRRVRPDRRKQRACNRLVEASRRTRRQKPCLPGQEGEIVCDQAIGVAVVIGTVADVVGDLQLLVRVIAADQPVEMVAEGVALKPKLLAEGLEAVVRSAVVVAVQDVEIVEVEVTAARNICCTGKR